MPHYADGTPAKVGDQVFGQFFNTPGVRAGTIISITPGHEQCNAMIQFTEAVMCPEGGSIDHTMFPRMAIRDDLGVPLQRVVRGEAHGASGPTYALFACADYCDTNKLTRLA